MNKTMQLGLAGALLAVALTGRAADGEAARAPSGVLNLSSSATIEVPQDWMMVTFSVSRDGADAQAVQAALKSALDTALRRAQAAREPDGRLEVETGGFSMQPRYTPKGAINGWTGTAELRVQGRDMPAIATLAGRIDTLTVAHVDYTLSREARQKVEGQAAAQAIAAFRAKAADYAHAFGYADYRVREVNVQTELPFRPPGPVMVRAMAASIAPEPLPTEAGKGSVTSTVNGSVQLVQ